MELRSQALLIFSFIAGMELEICGVESAAAAAAARGVSERSESDEESEREREVRRSVE